MLQIPQIPRPRTQEFLLWRFESMCGRVTSRLLVRRSGFVADVPFDLRWKSARLQCWFGG
jgi:hypothetical protein